MQDLLPKLHAKVDLNLLYPLFVLMFVIETQSFL